jgi:hypothetical protein
MSIAQLNKWVWTEAVGLSDKSSGSRGNNMAASGGGKQASMQVDCDMSGVEMRYKAPKIYIGSKMIKAVSQTAL